MRQFIKQWNEYWFAPVAGCDFATSRMVFIFLSILVVFPRSRVTALAFEADSLWSPINFLSLFHQSPISPSTAGMIESALFVAGFLSLIGLFSQISSSLSFALLFLLNVFMLSFGNFYRDNHLPVIIWGILAISRFDRRFSMDFFLFKSKAWLSNTSLQHRSSEYNWPHKLIQSYILFIYFEAGMQKLRFSGMNWFLSDNFHNILRLPMNPSTSFGLLISDQHFLSYIPHLIGA